MNVTSAAKSIANANPGLSWPGMLPLAVYTLNVPQLPTGAAMELGEDFHANFDRHMNGEWVCKNHYYTCAAIVEILGDLGIARKSLRTEVPLSAAGMTGRADIVGCDSNGQSWVVDIKTTQGKFALAPSPVELCQLALYADLLGLRFPVLACLRINLRLGKISVFHISETEHLIQVVKESALRLGRAA